MMISDFFVAFICDMWIKSGFLWIKSGILFILIALCRKRSIFAVRFT